MKLRKLEKRDAPLMLEWMHDESVVGDLHANFTEKTITDCLDFIEMSRSDSENIHLAIVSDEDEYMGTVSLKHVNYEMRNAEFAITVRKSAMGKGYSWYGMNAIMEKAFGEYGLQCVYWCVSRKNKRAVRFYDKHGFSEANALPQEIYDAYKDMDGLKWYAVEQREK